jgi:hypothetical protein
MVRVNVTPPPCFTVSAVASMALAHELAFALETQSMKVAALAANGSIGRDGSHWPSFRKRSTARYASRSIAREVGRAHSALPAIGVGSVSLEDE